LFSEDDVAGRRQVVVVSDTLARQYFGDGDPVGRLITIDAFGTLREGRLDDPRFEVVGVVADVKSRGPRESSWPEAFAPSSVTWAYGRSIVVKTENDRAPMIASIRSAIWAVDRNLVIVETGTVEGLLSRYSYAEPRFSVAVLSAFAVVGLVLVMLGVYGAIAYSVSRQTRAIGIRMALGARPRDVRGMVLTRTLRMVFGGGVLGVLAALLATRVLSTQLWGVTSNDPATLGMVVALVVVVGLAAGYFPARRATRVDPMVALRYE
jgi:putative ABC transport system permease protein